MRFYPIISIILIFLSLISFADVTAESSLWLQKKFTGKSCNDLNQNDITHVESYLKFKDCSFQSKDTQSSVKDFNLIAEAQYFNFLAKQEYEQTSCAAAGIDFFSKNPKLIKLRSEELSAKLPFIQEQMGLTTKIQSDLSNVKAEVERLSILSANLACFSESCMNQLNKAIAESKSLETKLKQHQGLLMATVGSLWNGKTESMSRFVESLAKRSPTPSTQKIEEEFIAKIPEVKAEIEENKTSLEKQSHLVGKNRVFNNLSDKTKRQLIENSVNDGFFAQAIEKKDESMITLLCRLNGKYTTGRDKLNIVVGAGSLFFSFGAGILSKIPLAVRAVQLSNVASKIESTSVTMGMIAVGIDAGIMTKNIQQACFADELHLVAKNVCPRTVSEYNKYELTKLKNDNCVLEVAMNLAPVGVLMASTAFKTLTPILKTYKAAAQESGARTGDRLKTAYAISAAKKLDASRNSLPAFSQSSVTQNQQQAELYFKKHGLNLDEVKPTSGPDQRKVDLLDQHIQQNKSDIETLNASIARTENLIKQTEIKVQELQTRRAQLQEEIKSKTNALNDLKIRLKNAEQNNNAAQDIQKIKNEIHQAELDLQKLGHEDKMTENQIKASNSSLYSLRRRVDSDHSSKEVRAKTIATKESEKAKALEEKIPLTKFGSSVEMQIRENKPLLSTSTPKERAAYDETLKSYQSLEGQIKVFTFAEIPKANPKADGLSPFWQHPSFKDRMTELRAMGVEVVVDPQKKNGAFYSPGAKAIYMPQDMSYHVFEHEFTHAQYDAYLRKHIDYSMTTLEPKFRFGTKLTDVLPADSIQKIGAQNIEHLQGLMQTYQNPLTVNESLAVEKQLNSMGWKPVSRDYYHSKAYGGYFRVTELLEKEKVLGLTESDKAILNQELIEMGSNVRMSSGIGAVTKQIEQIRTDISNGKIPTATSALQNLKTQMDRHPKDETSYFYNENGDLVYVPKGGNKIEYLSLKK